MARSARSVVLLGSLATSIALLSACGKKAPEVPSTPPPTASTTAIAPATSPTTIPATAPLAANPAMQGSSATASASSIAAPASSSSSIVAAEAPTPLSVAKITLGDSVNSTRQVAHNNDHFSADNKTIYATVATAGDGSDVKLSAKWSYLEGKGQVISNISQPVTTHGPAFTTFKVENPDLWPEGKYRVEIALNGQTVGKQDFRIGKH